MIHVPRRRGWEIHEREATPEAGLERREFLKRMGLASAALATADGLARGVDSAIAAPARRNPAFDLDRAATDEAAALEHARFREFAEPGASVVAAARGFHARPWRVEIGGLVARPRSIDLDDLIRRMPIEERLYRHRTLDGWSKVVPWTGFPLRELVRWVEPLAAARYLRCESFLMPHVAPNQGRATWYPWPYHEAYRMDEVMNELAFAAVGVYGHELPAAHGAPLRIAMPWKYGYKSAKSIARIEFTSARPSTFWTTIDPEAYGFIANVDPALAHPRWPQATERVIGTGEVRATQAFNGYGAWVASMYEGGRPGDGNA